MKQAIALLGLMLAACGGGAAATPAGTPAMTVQLTAKDLAYDQTSFTVPADVTFAVEFNNQDAAPHNVAISGNGVSQSSEPFSGPDTRTYVFAGLPAGTYSFACSIHSDMHGVGTSQAQTGSVP